MWIWLLLAVLPSCQVNGGYWLSTAETHILFSGDIEVSFGISTSNLSLRIQLFQNDTDGEKSIATRILPTNMIKGKIIFPCGTFQSAGQYVFKLLNAAQGELLTESNYVNALWPEVAIHVPLMVETYSSNVIVQLYTDHLKCRPRVNYQIFVDLLYEGSVVDAWLKPTILTSKQLTDWMWNSSFDVTLGCEFFDRAGNYTVHVRKDAYKIASSDIILVMWSHRYSVSVAKRSIQPCDGSLSVIYHYPRCILDQDRIRVYGKSVKGPLKYIRESRIINGKHATKLSCDIFEDGYQEYCFNFVSIARNGAVFDLKTHCIPTLVESIGFQANWNAWSTWSECSASCGVGMQTRFRLCISSNNNSNCVGKPVQSQTCKQKICPEEVTVTTTEQPQLLDDCPCGCEKNATDKIVLKAVIQRCDSEVSYIMHAWPSGHVVVNVLSVAFPTDNYWLIVRDGKSPLGPVLALMEDVTASNSIHSITRTIRLEIHVSNSTTLQEVVLIFSVMQSEIPRESLAMVRHNEKSISISSNLSAVHVTIIMLATVLFSTTAVLILFHFCRYMRTSSISQNTQALDSPELLTSTSELSIKSPSIGPEDYLYNSFIFRSSTSLQPRLKWDKLPPKVDVVNTASPVRRRSRPIIKNAQRESATPLTASVSELSTNGSDDGLEYDYYDYGCHQEPGSFFCPDPVLMGWPPFIPLPPQGIEEFGDYPLQNFTPSPEPS